MAGSARTVVGNSLARINGILAFGPLWKLTSKIGIRSLEKSTTS